MIPKVMVEEVERSTAKCDEMHGASTFSGLPVYQDLWVNSSTGTDLADAEVQVFTRWAVCLFRAEEDPERWVTADVVALPGVASEGATEGEAIENVKEALRLALASAEGEIEVEVPSDYEIPPGGRIVFVNP